MKTSDLCRQERGQPDGHVVERHQDAEARGYEGTRQESGEQRGESARRQEGQDEGLGRVRHHTTVHAGSCGCLWMNTTYRGLVYAQSKISTFHSPKNFCLSLCGTAECGCAL